MLNLTKLEAYLEQQHDRPGQLSLSAVTPLQGGYSGLDVARYDLIFQAVDGPAENVSLVEKFCRPAEVRVMQVLAEFHAPAFPALIDYASDMHTPDQDHAHWIVTPFYTGRPLDFGDEVPDEVVGGLARLHAHFAGRVEQFGYLSRVDGIFFRRMFDRALAALEKVLLEKPNPHFSEAQRLLIPASASPLLFEALAALPLTLVHGDVHPGNILHLSDGQSILIDWGNARIGPAMLDIADLIPIDSPNWEDYLAAYQAASGAPLDLRSARLGYCWAEAMVNTMYLPFSVERMSPEHTLQMAQKTAQMQAEVAAIL